MKILFLTPRFPYPVNRGDKGRCFHIARVLSKQHELSLLSFIQSQNEREFIPHLKEFFKEVHIVYLQKIKSYINMGSYFCKNKPLQVGYFRSNKFLKKLKELLAKERYDIVYAFHIRMAPYLQICSNTYRILDLTDAVSLFMNRLYNYVPWYKKPLYSIEIGRLQKYERETLIKFEECWIVSDEDKAIVENGRVFENLHVVPLGVDNDFFRSIGATFGKNIIFVGYMGVESVDSVLYFYNKIWPKVKSMTTGAKFYIIGANPPSKIKKLHNRNDMFVTGFVSDLKEYYQKAAVVIAPMRFVAGMQTKILEAMSMEVPVVTTSFGNEGINAQDGKEIFVENDPSDFAEKVSFLLNNPTARKEIGRMGREFVKAKYNWNNVCKRINVIEEVIKNNSHRDKQSKCI